MSFECKTLGPLADQFPATGLFGAWLRDLPIPASEGAGAQWRAALAAPGPSAKAPLWQDEEFAQLLPAEFQALPAGPAVVVTGQQPGFLGGPLLTLYKIATAIAAARQRTAAGRPTVAVFWSGDDDDDLAEALAPVGWDRGTQELWQSETRSLLKNPATQRGILADRPAQEWAAPVAGKLRNTASDDPLPKDLLALLDRAAASEQTWGEGQAALITRIFAGTDLVVIRGHDSRLHQLAAPLYKKMVGRMDKLIALAKERGAELAAAGFQAQISDRSLERPLFRYEGSRREFAPNYAELESQLLRPGVMLRSPVQDWLLQPAGVIVGPGELAYLRQLDPLYAALDLPRCPLVPRLSGWVLPEGDLAPGLVHLIRPAQPVAEIDPDLQAAAWAAQVVEPAQQKIADILAAELKLEDNRAEAMADSRARRFHKGVVAMFRAEIERQEKDRVAAAPQWVLPAGQRQERTLGLLSALDLWGSDLVTGILQAAEQHLDFGQQDSWQEMAFMVPQGTVRK